MAWPKGLRRTPWKPSPGRARTASIFDDKAFRKSMRGTLRALQELSKADQNKAIRRSLTKAIKPAQADLKRRLPKKTRSVEKSLGTKTKTFPRRGGPNSTVWVGLGQDKAKMAKVRKIAEKWYKRGGGISRRGQAVPLHLIDQGTKPHRIQVDTKHNRGLAQRMGLSQMEFALKFGTRWTDHLRWWQNGTAIMFRFSVQHPGAFRGDYVRKAGMVTLSEQQAIFRREMGIEIKKLADKARAKSRSR